MYTDIKKINSGAKTASTKIAQIEVDLTVIAFLLHEFINII
jgi:hypothetical protein